MGKFSLVGSSFSSELKKVIPLDKVGWDTPFYIELSGQLVACKFVRWFYPIVHSNDVYAEVKLANGMHISNALLLNNGFFPLNAIKVCGGNELKDKLLYLYDKKYNHIKLNLTTLNLENWMPMIMSDFDYTEYKNGSYVSCVKWYWDGVKAVSATIALSGLQYDKKLGLHYDDMKYVSNGVFIDEKMYATKEECEENNSINVIDFEDDKEEEAESICIAHFSVKVKTKNIEDLSKALRSFNVTDYSIFTAHSND